MEVMTSLLVLIGTCAVIISANSQEEKIWNRVNSPRFNYMMRLQSQLIGAKEDSLTADPTSVFCLADYDVINNQSRHEVPAEYQTRCSSVHRFHFEWDSGETNRSLPLASAYLRLYVQLINRLIPEGTGIPVSIEAYIDLTSNLTEYESSASTVNETSFSFLNNITFQSNDSDDWLEIDVSQELANVWDQLSNHKIIDITLRFSVNCTNRQKKVLKLVSPATLNHTPKRERQLALQPLFVVYIDDINIKKLRAKSITINESGPSLAELGQPQKRRKRRSPQLPGICHLENFVINFTAIGISNIVEPPTMNIKRCVGGCSLFHLQRAPVNLSTNHARIMASAHAFREDTSLDLLPRCTPTEYDDKQFLMLTIGANITTVEIRLYPNLVVKECACR